MEEKGRISITNIAVLVFLSIIGDCVLVYPSLITSISKQDAWISSLLSIPAGLAVLLLLLRVHQLYPDLTFVQLCQRILGPWLGALISIWYLFHLMMNSAIYLREVGDFMNSQTYVMTPLPVINLLLILVLMWGMYMGLEPIARTAQILFPLCLAFALFLILCLLPQCDSQQLKPIMEQGIPKIMEGSLFALSYPFGELAFLLMIFPYVSKKPGLKKSVLLSGLTASILLSVLLLVSLMVLGPFVTEHSVYTSYTLSKKINIGNFLQRIESMMSTAWIITTFVKTILHFYAFTLGITQLLRLNNVRTFLGPSFMILFGLIIVSAPNITYYLDTIVNAWIYWDLTDSVVLPSLLLIVYKLRSKGRHSLEPS
ncbi:MULTISPECIES: GerAB/ArcD/ProY family transporter [Paenibacillus]|uniref:GerAB/ArcD/ProY family transporter n=1 Tax=Paenibacillus TaxID=44249 RepID=UPI0008D48062|nr:endospore germination permease [Paenibacillus polymyxa]SEK10369.1 spore germination protein KB [Paenibacillus polymyxa]